MSIHRYSKQDILEILISDYKLRATFDPTVIKGKKLNFDTTIFEWRDICDLVYPKELAKVYADFFDLELHYSEIEKIFLKQHNNTLEDFCEYVSLHANREEIELIKILGHHCQTASIFLALKRKLKAKGVDVTNLSPSTKMNSFFLDHGNLLFVEVNKIAPGALNEFKFIENKWSNSGEYLILGGLICGLILTCIGISHWILCLPIVAGIVMIRIGFRQQPKKMSIGGFDDFRELIYSIDRKMTIV